MSQNSSTATADSLHKKVKRVTIEHKLFPHKMNTKWTKVWPATRHSNRQKDEKESAVKKCNGANSPQKCAQLS